MTISPFTIYLWGIADQIGFASRALASGLLVLGTFFYICARCSSRHSFDSEESRGDIKTFSGKLLKAAILPLVLAVFMPDKKTISCMVILPAIADSRAIQQDLPELYNMAVEALKDQLKPAK